MKPCLTLRGYLAAVMLTLLCVICLSPATARAEQQTECPPQTVSDDLPIASGIGMATSCDTIIANGITDVSETFCREAATEILSRIMCTVESKLTTAASLMYCGVAKAIEKPLSMAILLYITIFGFTVALGISKITFGDAAVRGLKICLVWLTATKAEYGISLLYKFFMGIVREGVKVITQFQVWGAPDAGGGAARVNECGSGSEGVGTFLNISELTGNLLGIGSASGGAGSMLGIMAHFMLTDFTLGLIGIVLFLVASLFLALAFLRMVMAYLLALVVIAFLVSLAPIFIMLALFNQYATFREYFDNWLNTLASHAVQPIFLFAVLFFVVAMMIADLQFLSNMARPCATINAAACGSAAAAVPRDNLTEELQSLELAPNTQSLAQPSACSMRFDEIKIGTLNVAGFAQSDITFPGYIVYYGKFDASVINTYRKGEKCITSIDVSPEGNRNKGAAVRGFIYKSDTPGQGQISFCGNKRDNFGSGGATVSAIEEGLVGPGSCSGDFVKAFIFHMLLIIIKCGLLFAYLDSAADHIAALATRFAERLGGTSPFTARGGSANVRMLSSNYAGALNKLTRAPGGTKGRSLIDRAVGMGEAGPMERKQGESLKHAAGRRGLAIATETFKKLPGGSKVAGAVEGLNDARKEIGAAYTSAKNTAGKAKNAAGKAADFVGKFFR